MANDATYNKFGKLIKINGLDSSKWGAYLDAQKAGNIVFADLRATAKTGDVSNYPAGCYIWANGLEYKVADLSNFVQLQHEFEDYVAATNASIARIDTSINNADASIEDLSTRRVQNLEDWRAAMGIVVDKDGKAFWINGIDASVKFAGSEYQDVSVDGSTFNFGIFENKIQFGAVSTGDTRKLATKGYVDDLETRVNTSMGIMNASIADISSKLVDISTTRLPKLVENTSIFATVADNSTKVTLSQMTEAGTTTTDSFVVTGDKYIKIEGSEDNIKLKLDIYNTSIDGLTEDNTSLYAVGSIKGYVDRKVSNLTGAIRLIGNVDSSNASTGGVYSPTSMKGILTGVDASKGNMWIATTSFDYETDNEAMGKITVMVESGDQVVITENRGTLTTDAPFLVIERNLDGAVTAGKNTFTKDHLIMADATGKQTVVDSGYTLGGNTSAGITGHETANVLATEQAVNEFVEKRIADISVNSVSDSSYFVTSAKRDGDVFTINSSINIAKFDDAENAVNSLADASTFYQAIKDVTGELVIEALADASANITLKMSGGDTSVRVNGGVYAIVERGGTDVSTLNLEVKTVDLRNAVNDVDGVAIAADVSSVINDVEKATAAAFAEVKKSVGLTENLGAQWSDTIKTNLGIADDSSVINTIEVLNASVTAEVNRLDASIIAMDLDNTELADKLIVGIAQKNGIVSDTSAEIWINGNQFKHAKDASAFQVTIDGADILVDGPSRHATSNIATAINDLSVAIDNVSTDCVKKVTGETALAPTAGLYAKDEYVAVTATRADGSNEVVLNSSVLIVNPADVSNITDYTAATAAGLVTNAYVNDQIAYTLAWECY